MMFYDVLWCFLSIKVLWSSKFLRQLAFFLMVKHRESRRILWTSTHPNRSGGANVGGLVNQPFGGLWYWVDIRDRIVVVWRLRSQLVDDVMMVMMVMMMMKVEHFRGYWSITSESGFWPFWPTLWWGVSEWTRNPHENRPLKGTFHIISRFFNFMFGVYMSLYLWYFMICMLRFMSSNREAFRGFADHPALGHRARWWCTFSTPLAEAFPKVPWWKDRKFVSPVDRSRIAVYRSKSGNWHVTDSFIHSHSMEAGLGTCYHMLYTCIERIPHAFPSNTAIHYCTFFWGVCVCVFLCHSQMHWQAW